MVKAVISRLKNPPIVEVICGFFFASTSGIDPILVGKYWSEHKQKEGYRERQIHPAIVDGLGFSVTDALGPLRCWLIKDTDDYVLQIQPDRLYFNWRKRKGGYPHFTDRNGTDGVLTKSLREFTQFAHFCESEPSLKQALKPLRLELAKVDLLVNPTHWKDYSDLGSLVPMIRQLPQITDEPTLNLSLVGQRDGFQVQFTVTNVVLTSDMSPAVKIETRVTANASADSKESLTAMNTLANTIFFDTISISELQRFGGVLE